MRLVEHRGRLSPPEFVASREDGNGTRRPAPGTRASALARARARRLARSRSTRRASQRTPDANTACRLCALTVPRPPGANSTNTVGQGADIADDRIEDSSRILQTTLSGKPERALSDETGSLRTVARVPHRVDYVMNTNRINTHTSTHERTLTRVSASPLLLVVVLRLFSRGNRAFRLLPAARAFFVPFADSARVF